MSEAEKKDKIKSLVIDMLKESNKEMIKKLDRVFNSGCIDVEGWSDKDSPMILPKCIISALLESEITQYNGKGTSHERSNKKEIRNIRYFI